MPAHKKQDTRSPLYAPGLKRRPHARYWMPPAKDIKRGYDTKSRRIPNDMTELQAAVFCRKCWADLEQWRNDRPQHLPGTWAWAIWHLRNDPLSPMNRLQPGKGRAIRESTRLQYEYCMRQIERAVGKRRIESTSGSDLLHWYDQFAGDAHFSKAHSIIGQLKRLAAYALFLGHRPARDVVELMGTLRFHGAMARTADWSFENIMKIISGAVEQGHLSIAIATLAQYEFTERRIHIIGNWEDAVWRPGWQWQGINYGERVGIDKDWRITYFQDKTQPTRRSYDLNDTPALLDLLEQIPQEERIGPVIICESTGRPWVTRSYGRTFREICRSVGLPDSLWSMDMRASGATEADLIPGVTTRDLQAAGGWTNPLTVSRYRRDKEEQARKVVRLRQASRGKP